MQIHWNELKTLCDVLERFGEVRVYSMRVSAGHV